MSGAFHQTVTELHDSDRENPKQELDALEDTSLTGRELGTSCARNGRNYYDIGDLSLDIEVPSHGRDRICNEENGEYLKFVY